MDLTIDNMTYDISYTGEQNLNYVGLLCGNLERSYLFDVTVKNSALTIASKSYVNNVGALIGRIGYSRQTRNVTSQDNTITITGTPNSTNHYSNNVGGLFGTMDYLEQYNSLSKFYSKNNTITLSGYGSNIGGLTNMNYVFSGQTETNNSEYLTLSEFHTENISITITDGIFNSNGNGQASSHVGGLLGYLSTNSNYSDKSHAELIKSSSTGTITLKMGREVGGLIGRADARISDVYSKVDINFELGIYEDWQNTSGNTTWSTSSLNDQYSNVGGLIGYLTYKERALSNSYSAASITVSGTNFTDALLYTDYTEDGNLDPPKRWGSVIGEHQQQ